MEKNYLLDLQPLKALFDRGPGEFLHGMFTNVEIETLIMNEVEESFSPGHFKSNQTILGLLPTLGIPPEVRHGFTVGFSEVLSDLILRSLPPNRCVGYYISKVPGYTLVFHKSGQMIQKIPNIVGMENEQINNNRP